MRTHVHRPVFVMGPPRSGATLLAWALGEHPRLTALLETAWMGRVARALASEFHASAGRGLRSQIGVRGPELEGFLALFAPAVDAALGVGEGAGLGARPDPRRGRAHGHRAGIAENPRSGPDAGRRGSGEVEGLVGEGPVRWVDGTPENALHAYALHRLFPGARFIHVVRDLDHVVDGLVDLGVPDGSYFTRESACETWLRYTRACLRTEEALGPALVHRVHFDTLVASPEPALRRCLDFLGEDFHPACLRLLRGVGRGPIPGGRRIGTASRAESDARALDRNLRRGAGGPEEPDPDVASDLERELREGIAELGELETPVERIRAIVCAAVVPGSIVAVVSRGDEELVRIPDRVGWHFPQVDGGVYAGHHPADGEEAVAHLEELRTGGAEYLLLPCTAFWWLDHYPELRSHLEARGRLVAYHDDGCVLFALGPAETGEPLEWRWRVGENGK